MQAEHAAVGIGFFEDAALLVELVEFLGEVEDEVGHHRGATVLGSLVQHHRPAVHHHDDFLLLGLQITDFHFAFEFNALFFGLAQHRTDTCVGVLHKRTRVAIEVDGLLRIEEHCLLRINLEDEILQGTESDGVIEFVGLFRRKVFGLAKFVGNDPGCGHHLIHKVIRIDHRALTRLHLAIRQLDHAVGQMLNIIAPLATEAHQNALQHIEVVNLLITNDINQFFGVIFVVA